MEHPTTHKPQNLSGRRAVITGGAAGLGRAIAELLADAGAHITVIDLEQAFAEAKLPEDWHREELGSVDILIANAGLVPPWRGVASLDAGEWQRVMSVNTWGVAASLGGFSAALARSDHGSIVVMASINGYKAHPEQVLYTASKHAVIGIMRAAALDLGRHGIRVNALAPGPIATDALQERISSRHAAGGPDPQAAFAALNADTALGAIATPAQVASAALWLASDASAGITGVVLPIEAGLA
jgi:NAD(P)-dependent dehydrogenase (short-subunit alcohol dehydrogenase family)